LILFLSLSGSDDALTGTVAGGFVAYGHVVQSYSGTVYGSVANDGALGLTFDPAPEFAAAGQIMGKASGSTLEVTYPDASASLVTLTFARSDAAAYNTALDALREQEATAQAAEDEAEASAQAEASAAAAIETCTRAVVNHDAVIWAYNPGRDAATACKDIKRYAIDDGRWDLPVQPAAPVTGSIVCSGRLDGMLVNVYDAGSQYYGGLVCNQLPALPFIGINYDSVTDGLQVRLDGVVSGSPAAKAGVRERDIITAIDGSEVFGDGQVNVILSRHGPNDVVTLSILRGSESLNLQVKLGRQP
jgi:hypothetical protein